MTKTELVANIMSKTGQTKTEIEKTVSAMTEAISEALSSGDQVALVGFGTFKTSKRAARTGKNPQTGEAIQIAASISPTFKAGKKLKEAVNA